MSIMQWNSTMIRYLFAHTSKVEPFFPRRVFLTTVISEVCVLYREHPLQSSHPWDSFSVPNGRGSPLTLKLFNLPSIQGRSLFAYYLSTGEVSFGMLQGLDGDAKIHYFCLLLQLKRVRASSLHLAPLVGGACRPLWAGSQQEV